ncbi:MAG TPA: transcription termination/antitermination protein NusA [Candidatus Hydrogenedentes bacterium]|nr:transcription termination/antitermination protein NusA [Candidatus Hydrogenedentota bacterium]
MDTNLRVILQQLEAEKSIDRNRLLEAICSAIETAARKSFTHAANVSVEVDSETLEFKVFEIRTVVDRVEDPSAELSLEKALELNPHVVVGNRLKVPADPSQFGRIAAQTAKQVIIQKIKDAERENVFEQFKQREGELVTGIVKRINHGNVIVSIGKAEAVLPHREQSPREVYKPGDRIRAYLLDVDKSGRGAQLVLSRTTPELVRGLFELEVPEIYDGTIEIKAVAREPGSRTKVAVHSNDPNVDPVGACVGMKGSRVRTVVEDLAGEKIDIVRWSEDAVEFCGNALNPADIQEITIEEEKGEIHVVVPYDQLSLAIGKRGQNARLASRLIGWNIDIRSAGEPEDVVADEAAGVEPEATDTIETNPSPEPGVGEAAAESTIEDGPSEALGREGETGCVTD